MWPRNQRAPHRRSSRAGGVVRQAHEDAGRLHRERLVARRLDDRMRLPRAPQRPDAVWPRPAHARRPDPLGRDRDFGSLVRLHGRRSAIGRTGRGGSAGLASEQLNGLARSGRASLRPSRVLMPARTEPRPPKYTFFDSQDHARSFSVRSRTVVTSPKPRIRQRTGEPSRPRPTRGTARHGRSKTARPPPSNRRRAPAMPAARRLGRLLSGIRTR